jgi:hypothetical protein
MYNKLSKFERRGKLGSKIQKIPGAQREMSVRWFTYRVLEPNLDWTAVILRGIKDNISKKEIEEAFNGLFIRAEQPRLINMVFCTIVIVQNILEAEKIIRNYSLCGLGGKADIHPYSSMFKNPEQSAEMVFNEYKKKKKMILQSGYLKMLNLTDNNLEIEDTRSLISSVSGTIEDGEITDTDAPPSETSQNYYLLYEYPGSYINQDGENSMHSGVFIKTVYSFQNNL